MSSQPMTTTDAQRAAASAERSTSGQALEWFLDRYVAAHPATPRHGVTVLELAVWLDQQSKPKHPAERKIRP